MQGDETEVHDGYVLIDHVDPNKGIREVLDRLFEDNPTTVRFVAQFAGPFIGFVAMTVSDLGEVHALADGPFWEAGLRCETLLVIKRSNLEIPKRGSPDVCAMVRAAADDPDVALDALDETFGPRQDDAKKFPYEDRVFNYGAAIVNGRFDLLIDLGAPNYGDTVGLVREVRSIPGIRKTVTAFAHLPGNARRRDI